MVAVEASSRVIYQSVGQFAQEVHLDAGDAYILLADKFISDGSDGLLLAESTRLKNAVLQLLDRQLPHE